MNKHDFEEILVKAIQSGKQETSGLAGYLKDEMKELRKMQEQQNILVNKYIEKDTEDKEKIFAWQEKANPALEIMHSMRGFASTGGWILKGVLLIGGAVGVLYGGIVFIKNYFVK